MMSIHARGNSIYGGAKPKADEKNHNMWKFEAISSISGILGCEIFVGSGILMNPICRMCDNSKCLACWCVWSGGDNWRKTQREKGHARMFRSV